MSMRLITLQLLLAIAVANARNDPPPSDGRAFAQSGESIRFRRQRKPTRLVHNTLRRNYLGLTNRGKRFFRALAKLFRSRAEFSFARNDSNREALWFGC